jgi:hypothetical protein
MIIDDGHNYIIGMIRCSCAEILLVSRIVHSLLTKGNHVKVESLIIPPPPHHSQFSHIT